MLTIWTIPSCPQCTKTIAHADRLAIPVKVLPMSPERLELAKEQGFMAAPVVDADDGTSWAGYQAARIILHARNYHS